MELNITVLNVLYIKRRGYIQNERRESVLKKRKTHKKRYVFVKEGFKYIYIL
jgi:hypothetical protein